MAEKSIFSFKYLLKLFIIMSILIILSTIVIFVSFGSFFSRPFGATYSDTMHVIKHLKDFLLPIIIFSVGVFVVIASLLVAVVCIIMLHKVAGPTVRVERVLDDLANGLMVKDINFRKGDQLEPLSESLTALGEKLNEDFSLIDDCFSKMERLMEESHGGESDRNERLEEIIKFCQQVKSVTAKYDRG